MTSQAIVSYFWYSQTFSIFMQYMSVSHGYSTMVEYNGGCGEDKKEKIVSHQLGVSTGYGDAINWYQCEWVGIAMQRMH